MDHTIPRQRRDGHPIGSLTWGYFVQRTSSRIELRDRANRRWALNQVTIQHGGWGFDGEGVAKLPRPSVYNEVGKEIIKGDRVLIGFIDDSRKQPVVFPGFRRIGARAGAFLPYNHTGADPNRYATRVQPLDATGQPIGSVDTEAGYDGKAAVRVSVGPPDGAGPRTFAALDDSDGSATIGTKDGATVRIAKGQIAVVSAEGHIVLLDAQHGIQLGWSKGGQPGGTADPLVVLKEGLLQILSTLTQIVGRTELSDGTPALYPLAVTGIAGSGFYFDLATAMTAIGLLGVTPATDLAAKITAELAAPGSTPGYSSKVGKSS